MPAYGHPTRRRTRVRIERRPEPEGRAPVSGRFEVRFAEHGGPLGEIRNLRVVESEERAPQVVVQRRHPALGNRRSAVAGAERGSRRRESIDFRQIVRPSRG